MRLEVDAGGYVDACGEFYDTNHGIVDLMSTLSSAIDAGGGMAGTDTGGEAFAGEYDTAAGQLITAGCTLADGMGQMANLLNASLVNHKGAEYGAELSPDPYSTQSDGDDNPDHNTESLLAPAPPSAKGGTGDEPSWWHWIAGHVEGLLWPDADTGKLRSVGEAWKTAGSNLANWTYPIEAASGQISLQKSPEVPDAVAACSTLEGHVTQLSAAFTAIGNACSQYADDVDAHHQEVMSELESFIKWTVIIEGAGGVLAFFTAGISEAAAQAAEAGEVANAAQKVIRILNDLIELARLGMSKITDAVANIGELLAKLKNLISARVLKAAEAIGKSLSADSPEALKALEGTDKLTEAELKAIDFYTGPGYDSLNAHLRGIADAVKNGTATPEQLEEYSKLVSQGLDKLPKFTGTTLRGTNLPQSVLDSMDTTGKFSDPAFMSSSTSESVAAQFRGNGNAILHIEGTTGHDVQALSQYKNESEVLFDKGTDFDVVSKVWNDKGYWDITLKETP